MKPLDIILYILTVISFLVASCGIMRGKKAIAICGIVAMAILTAVALFSGWVYA